MANKTITIGQTTTSNGVNVKINGTLDYGYATCSTAAATAAKTIDMPNFELITGAQIRVKFTNNNTVASPTLNVNSTGAKAMVQYGTTAMSSTSTVNGWQAGAVIPFTYDGTSWVRDYWVNTTYYNTSFYCSTSSTVSAKVGSGSAYTLANNQHFQIMMINDNTISSSITLNINGAGAKPIYINGSASSSTNYTLPKGPYIVYYNGTNYYFRTDGTLTTKNLTATATITTAYLNATTTSTFSGKIFLNSSLYGQTAPSTGSEGQLYFVDADDSGSLPGGGSQGQVLVKQSSADYDAAWSNTVNGSLTLTGNLTADKVYGAVWNDYAEYRICTKENIDAGRCVVENGDDTLSMSTDRMQAGAEIVSDTYGYVIGEKTNLSVPVAVSGRVLAYFMGDKKDLIVGQPVCSGPNGTVTQMTDEEAKEKPWCIIGTVSAVPSYTTWGNGIDVDNRIWIRIK